MNGATIADKVRYGYGKAGEKLGLPHDLYRATSATVAALDPRNRLRALSFIAASDPRATFDVPSKHGNPYRYALTDTRAPLGAAVSAAIEPGDYITGPTGTHFVLSVQPDEIPMVAECNATVSIYRPVQHTKANESTYGGRSTGTDTLLVQSFPAAIFDGGRQQATRADLPGDLPIKGSTVLLPALPGVLLRVMDHMIDDLGRRLTVSSAEISNLGWRLTAIASEA